MRKTLILRTIKFIYACEFGLFWLTGANCVYHELFFMKYDTFFFFCSVYLSSTACYKINKKIKVEILLKKKKKKMKQQKNC